MSKPKGSVGDICPFCNGADPTWPLRNKHVLRVECMACGAVWTPESKKWRRPPVTVPPAAPPAAPPPSTDLG